MNLKDLDALLVPWGLFWSSRESIQGYASKSVFERCGQVMRTGIWASSDKHLFNHQADQVYVPNWVNDIDRCVEQLQLTEHKSVINRRYIKRVMLNNLERKLLLRAKAELLGYF